jgi:hypothetical protein
MMWLTKGARSGDVLWCHFSGHGTQVRDRDGDEADGKDEAICTIDEKVSPLAFVNYYSLCICYHTTHSFYSFVVCTLP